MLMRIVASNILSFGEEREFNMLPSPRYSRLSHHKYKINNFELLKLSALYGANGAGKSNLIKILSYIVEIVKEEKVPSRLTKDAFKFSGNGKSQIIGIEFFNNKIPYYYGIEMNGNKVITEELYISGLGDKEDELVFERKTEKGNKISLNFFPEFEEDQESKILKKVLEKNLIKPEKPILKLLSTLDSPLLFRVEEAFGWFENCLQVVLPSSKPRALPQRIDKYESFKKYAREIMRSFGTGVNDIKVETKSLLDFFGEDDISEIQKLIDEFNEKPDRIMGIRAMKGEEIILVKENDEIVVKRLVLEHEGKNSKVVDFYINEESDGTIRLLDYIPLFHDIVNKQKVYIIDEIERSIHPLLVKELVKKFSEDKTTKGQLIFTTHESNLLDQELLRQDEIWFAEKDRNGCTDLYPLSEFKEHHTKNIRKGYLNGRYGAIPFLGSLKELNWTEHATTE